MSGIRFEGDEQARVQAFLDTPVQLATSPAPSVAEMDAVGLPLALQLVDEVQVQVPSTATPRGSATPRLPQ